MLYPFNYRGLFCCLIVALPAIIILPLPSASASSRSFCPAISDLRSTRGSPLPKSKTGNPLARFPALLVSWRPQQGSNLQRALRRGLLYPFNYEDLTHIILPQVPAPFQDGNRNKSRKILSFSARTTFRISCFLQNLRLNKKIIKIVNFSPFTIRFANIFLRFTNFSHENKNPLIQPSRTYCSNSSNRLFFQGFQEYRQLQTLSLQLDSRFSRKIIQSQDFDCLVYSSNLQIFSIPPKFFKK